MKRPDASDPASLRYRMRRARFVWIERLLDQILAQKDTATILDIGGRRGYWALLAPKYRPYVHVTILNTADELARDGTTDIGITITTVVGDGTAMPQYAGGAFDLTHSNSVIEHVGLYQTMAAFAAETARVGQAYYLQTPNFWFPLEPHYGVPFYHWLPEPIRLWLNTRLNVGFARRCDMGAAIGRVDHTRMVSRRLIRHLFPDSTEDRERFAGLTKSLIVYRDYPGAAGLS
ncbi:MAG: class I SAM-dependent methyltransferase [Pseudomonadota bacterium]